MTADEGTAGGTADAAPRHAGSGASADVASPDVASPPERPAAATPAAIRTRGPSSPQIRGTGAGWSGPDWMLALAVGSVLFVPSSYFASLVLAPVAWTLAERDRMRCDARHVAPTERSAWARTIGRAVTMLGGLLVGLPLAIAGACILATRAGATALLAALGVLAAAGAGTTWFVAGRRRRRRAAREARRSSTRRARRPLGAEGEGAGDDRAAAVANAPCAATPAVDADPAAASPSPPGLAP